MADVEYLYFIRFNSYSVCNWTAQRKLMCCPILSPYLDADGIAEGVEGNDVVSEHINKRLCHAGFESKHAAEERTILRGQIDTLLAHAFPVPLGGVFSRLIEAIRTDAAS